MSAQATGNFVPPDDTIPVDAVKSWNESRLKLHNLSWRFQVFEDEAQQTVMRDFKIRRLGEYWLLEEEVLEQPGKLSGEKSITVSGPKHKFVLTKEATRSWTAKLVVDSSATENHVDSTKYEAEHYSYLPVGWLPGQDFAKLSGNSSNFKILSDDRSTSGVLTVSYSSLDALKEKSRYSFDIARNWRLINGDRQPTQGNATSYIFEFKLEYPEALEFPQLLIETTRNISDGTERKVYTKISPMEPAQLSEFELPYYGLMVGESPRFWRTTTFWLIIVGLVAIATALLIKRRSALTT